MIDVARVCGRYKKRGKKGEIIWSKYFSNMCRLYSKKEISMNTLGYILVYPIRTNDINPYILYSHTSHIHQQAIPLPLSSQNVNHIKFSASNPIRNIKLDK